MIHELKTWTKFFQLIRSDTKTFELRFDDRGFKTDDELLLKEFDPDNGVYTGNILHRRVSYIFRDSSMGINQGYVIMSLERI